MALYDITNSWLLMVNESLTDGTDPTSGRNIFDKARNRSFTGKREIVIRSSCTITISIPNTIWYKFALYLAPCEVYVVSFQCKVIHIKNHINSILFTLSLHKPFLGITGNVVMDDDADRITPYFIWQLTPASNQMTKVLVVTAGNAKGDVRCF